MKKLLYQKYFEFYDKLTRKYGDNVALLLQMGGFFELYCDYDYSKTNVKELCKIMNIRLNPKDSRLEKSTRMAGFPIYNLDKFLKILVNHDYNVVVVEQIPQDSCITNVDLLFYPEDSYGERRAVTKIVSPSTYFDSEKSTNYIMSIYIEKYSANLYTLSISVIDVIISDNIITTQFQSTKNDKGYALDCVVEMLLQYNPIECIIITKHGTNVTSTVKKLGITCTCYYIDVEQINTFHTKCTDSRDVSIEALKQFLTDRFINTSNIQVQEYVPNKFLDLNSTCISQLDVGLLYKLLDKTVTPMGSRFLFHRLVHPIIDSSILQQNYDHVEKMSQDDYNSIKKLLDNIFDLDKFKQKLAMNISNVSNIRTFYNILLDIQSSRIILEKEYTPKIISFIKRHFIFTTTATTSTTSTVTHFDASENDDVEGDIEGDTDNGIPRNYIIAPHDISFNRQYYKDLDVLYSTRQKEQDVGTSYITKVQDVVHSNVTLKDNLGIHTTLIRAKQVLKIYPEWKMISLKKYAIVYTDELVDSLVNLQKTNEQITRLENKYFKTFQTLFYNEFYKDLSDLSNTIAELDFYQCSWNLVKNLRLCKPVIHTQSKLDVTELRHLLVENINPSVPYITNNIHLSQDNLGIIVYGVNSCGKSSLLKALGLCIIMVQAGLFAPCQEITLKPFKQIITRITGGDNLEKSQSSFIIELEEILSILNRANQNTLVLGDEICRGTESKSAVAINYSLLKDMLKKQCFFITTTHLHELYDHVNDIKKIDIYHMKVNFTKGSNDGSVIDGGGNQVEFNRKLVPGRGTELYGLEIASHLNFPKTFMNEALQFRSNFIWNTGLKKSRYNSKKIIEKCQLCQYKPSSKKDLPLDIHHINFQCNADQDGFHNTQNKNALHNLICLCKECHVKVHQGELEFKIEQGLYCKQTVKVTLG